MGINASPDGHNDPARLKNCNYCPSCLSRALFKCLNSGDLRVKSRARFKSPALYKRLSFAHLLCAYPQIRLSLVDSSEILVGVRVVESTGVGARVGEITKWWRR